MITRKDLDRLQGQAEILKKSLEKMETVCSERALIYAGASLYDDNGVMNGFSMRYYPGGKLKECTYYKNLSPLDIKDFTDDHPDADYFVFWEGCIEWEIANAETEKERTRLTKMLYDPEHNWDHLFISNALLDALATFPPIMHYTKSRDVANLSGDTAARN